MGRHRSVTLCSGYRDATPASASSAPRAVRGQAVGWVGLTGRTVGGDPASYEAQTGPGTDYSGPVDRC